MRSKPYVFRGIAVSLLMSVVHTIVYFIAAFILSFIFLFLSNLPLIGKLFDLFFFLRGDSPTMLATIVGAQLAYYAAKFIQTKVNNHLPTRCLSYKINAIGMLVVHGLSLILNIFYGEAFFPNIVFIVTAGVYFMNAANCKDEFARTVEQESSAS